MQLRCRLINMLAAYRVEARSGFAFRLYHCTEDILSS